MRLILKLLHRFDRDPAGDAVVHRLGDHVIAHLDARGVDDDHIADLDLLVDLGLGHPRVDEHLADIGDLLAFFRRRDVDRLTRRVHDAGDIFFRILQVRADRHAAGEEVSRVESADGVDVDEALVVDVGDQKADLVHVSREHDFLRRLLFSRCFLDRDDRAHGVDADRVEQPFDLFFDQLGYTIFTAGNAWGQAQFFEEFDIHSEDCSGSEFVYEPPSGQDVMECKSDRKPYR